MLDALHVFLGKCFGWNMYKLSKRLGKYTACVVMGNHLDLVSLLRHLHITFGSGSQHRKLPDPPDPIGSQHILKDKYIQVVLRGRRGEEHQITCLCIHIYVYIFIHTCVCIIGHISLGGHVLVFFFAPL